VAVDGGWQGEGQSDCRRGRKAHGKFYLNDMVMA